MDRATLYKAFRSRDKRFDGRFYVGVRTTGIYCRPVCPARPLLKNCVFYRSAAEAEAAGLRPCLRCRPDLSPSAPLFQGTGAVVGRALRLLDQGEEVAGLADRLGMTDRHLRRLFAEHVGASPVEVAGSRRLHLARLLLSQTAKPVTEIAFASGFKSLRRFNAAFLERYRRSPRDFRKSGSPSAGLRLEIPVLEPYDWDSLYAFLARHETCAEGKYIRALPRGARCEVSRGKGCLVVELFGCEVAEVRNVLERVRGVFDVDHNPAVVPHARGLRIPGAWDGFETAVGIIVGQVVSAAGARRMLSRIVEKYGAITPAALADVEGCGLTRAKAGAIRALARSGIDLSPAAPLAETRAALLALPGLGPWTVELIALRCLRDPDAFPANDLAVARALQSRAVDPEKWHPWRGYLTLWIWKQYIGKKGKP